MTRGLDMNPDNVASRLEMIMITDVDGDGVVAFRLG
jgi:hypothetical protein